MSDVIHKLYPPHSMFDLLPIHHIVTAHTAMSTHRLMWRGHGRFTNLDSGSEWFVESLKDMTISIPAFTIEV